MTTLPEMTFTRRACNGVTLHVAEAGPQDGTPVILLHGFPEFWYGWRYQIGALAEAGYRVVVPDQRGYDLSDKPKGIANYDVDKLADDVVALAAHYTSAPVNLFGHDWGGDRGVVDGDAPSAKAPQAGGAQLPASGGVAPGDGHRSGPAQGEQLCPQFSDPDPA